VTNLPRGADCVSYTLYEIERSRVSLRGQQLPAFLPYLAWPVILLLLAFSWRLLAHAVAPDSFWTEAFQLSGFLLAWVLHIGIILGIVLIAYVTAWLEPIESDPELPNRITFFGIWLSSMLMALLAGRMLFGEAIMYGLVFFISSVLPASLLSGWLHERLKNNSGPTQH